MIISINCCFKENFSQQNDTEYMVNTIKNLELKGLCYRETKSADRNLPATSGPSGPWDETPKGPRGKTLTIQQEYETKDMESCRKEWHKPSLLDRSVKTH